MNLIRTADRVTLPSAPAPGLGLTTAEALRVRAEIGPNALVPLEHRSGPWAAIRRVVTDPMALLLAVAAATYFALGETEDAIIAAVALIPVIGVSVVLDLRAEQALESLRQLTAATARVIRDGVERAMPALDIVPGDAIVVHEGDVVPADARLVDGADLVIDESALTGESHPVTKARDAQGDADISAGTTVLSGRATAVVTTTGPATRYGQIGRLVAHIAEAPTPLQALVRRLFIWLSIVALAFCVGVVAVELAQGTTFAEALIAGVSLAMAAIPEEFPMVFTLYLGLGAWRLARDRALVRRLVGVETLGATSVIGVDKTGTLTLGTIEVERLWVAPGAGESELMRAAVLASEPTPYDPLEQAIVRAATVRGIDAAELHANALVRDHPFDPASRSLVHVWREGDLHRAYAKGALEAFATRGMTAPPLYEAAVAANDGFASRGMRVIAVATSAAASPAGDRRSDEAALTLIGLIAFADPIRPGVTEAMAECRAAGIRVVMITGDHPLTARAVAADVGFSDIQVVTGAEIDATSDDDLGALVATANVYARARPEQKHRLVLALKKRGEVVAMTGDGTNDAPALRAADVGIAMGRRGTEVARQAATIVLLDDDFSTIVAAVRDGRRIFANLRRAFSYLVAFHAPLLLSAIVVPFAGAPLLLLPVHLVLLELVLHPTVALTFEADPPSPRLMRRPPRRREAGLLGREQLLALLARGVALTAGVLGLYLGALAIGWGEEQSRGLALIALLLGQLLLVLVERSDDLHVWHRISDNKALPWIGAGTVALLLAIELVPPIASGVHIQPPPPIGWLAAVAVGAATTLWGELAKRDIATEDQVALVSKDAPGVVVRP